MGPEDLAIGSDGASVGFAAGCGVVNVIYGTTGQTWLDPFGPSPAQVWHQDSLGIPNTAEPGDEFGRVLAAGDFDGNGATGSGVTSDDAMFLTRWTQGVTGKRYSHAWFGCALAAGNFDGSGGDDLAIGVPGDSVGNPAVAAGAINVVYGEVLVGLNPLGFPAAQLMHQNSTGMPEKAEDADSFGLSLGSR